MLYNILCLMYYFKNIFFFSFGIFHPNGGRAISWILRICPLLIHAIYVIFHKENDPRSFDKNILYSRYINNEYQSLFAI